MQSLSAARGTPEARSKILAGSFMELVTIIGGICNNMSSWTYLIKLSKRDEIDIFVKVREIRYTSNKGVT